MGSFINLPNDVIKMILWFYVDTICQDRAILPNANFCCSVKHSFMTKKILRLSQTHRKIRNCLNQICEWEEHLPTNYCRYYHFKRK